MRLLDALRQPVQIGERRLHQWPLRQHATGGVEDLGPAVQLDQLLQCPAHLVGKVARQLAQGRCILRGERGVDLAEPLGIDHHPGQHAAHDARVAQVERHTRQTGAAQAVEREVLDLEVGFEPAVSVDLGTELQGFACRLQTGRQRVQHRAAVAQADDTAAVQQVGVDARHLRRAVGTHAERAAAELVDELEGLQVQRTSGPGQQRLDVLEQRRHHQLATIAARHVDQASTKFLDVPRLRRQHIGNVLGQQPSR